MGAASLFFPFLPHIFRICISAFRCREDKYSATLTGGALVNSFNPFPWVANSSLPIFPEVPPSTFAVSKLARRFAPYPHPWLWSSFTEGQGVRWNVHPTCKHALEPCPLTHAQRNGWANSTFCSRNDVVLPLLPWLGWSSAPHSGKHVYLDLSRSPWPFMLQLPFWTWSCTCRRGTSCLTALLLPHHLIDSWYPYTTVAWRCSWP